jgi:adenylylsulfate kinase
VEVHVDCALSTAEERDPKGLYKKARAGEIKNFTGIDDPYEEPDNPEIHLHTDEMTLVEEVEIIVNYLLANDIIRREYYTRANDNIGLNSASAV